MASASTAFIKKCLGIQLAKIQCIPTPRIQSRLRANSRRAQKLPLADWLKRKRSKKMCTRLCGLNQTLPLALGCISNGDLNQNPM